MSSPALLLSALADQTLYTTVTGLVVALLSHLLRRQPPRLHYGLWSLVVVRFLLPPELSAPFAMRHFLGEWRPPTAPPSVAPPPAGASGGTDVTLLARELRPDLGLWCLVGAWALLALFFWRRERSKRRRFAYAVHSGAPVRDPRVLAITSGLRRTLGIRRPVRLVAGSTDLPPFTVGVLKPKVFLPDPVLRHGSDELLASVLAHELVHVRRWDALRLELLLALRAIYFFHPVAWIAVARLVDEGERICDEVAVSRGALSPLAYGRSLLYFANPPLSEAPLTTPGFGSRKEKLKMRLEGVLSPNRPRRPVAAIVLTLTLGAALLPMAPAPAQPDRRSNPEDFLDPLPGARVTARFGLMKDPWTGEPREHRGIDLVRPAGAAIQAPWPGRVEHASDNPGDDRGTFLVLDHGDGLKTTYWHLETLAVRTGERVAAGAALGTLGNTGRSTGPHLHFEILRFGEPIDPATYVAAWRPVP